MAKMKRIDVQEMLLQMAVVFDTYGYLSDEDYAKGFETIPYIGFSREFITRVRDGMRADETFFNAVMDAHEKLQEAQFERDCKQMVLE